MKKLRFSACQASACLWLSVMAFASPAHAQQAQGQGQETPYTQAATAFFAETEVFGTQSSLLIDNTQEIDNALLTLENILSLQHKAAMALKQLDNTLTTTQQMIVVAKQIPQTRAQAEKLEVNLNTIHPGITRAAISAEKVDIALEPTRTATTKAERAAETALDYESKLRDFGLAYIDQVENLTQCVEAHPPMEPPATGLLGRSRDVFSRLDKGMTIANQTYANTVGAPAKAVHATIAEISKQVRQLEQMLAAITALQNQLQPLNEPLAELKKILDQSLGFSFPYPCGAKMCSQSTPYPCGVKTCKGSWGVRYPCGTKICHKEVPFPCGVNTCNASANMSVSVALNGADAIEHKIEAILSSAAWTALKTIGVKQYVDQISHQADSLLNPVLGRLHLDISPNLPNLEVSLNGNMLAEALPQFNLLAQKMTDFIAVIDMRNNVFAPEMANLNALQVDINNGMRMNACAAPAKLLRAVPQQQRIDWRTGRPYVNIR